jgi:hypothetical protein
MVNPLTTFVRSLGNDGAVANVEAMVAARRREEWLVQGLVLRLDRADASAVGGVAGAGLVEVAVAG